VLGINVLSAHRKQMTDKGFDHDESKPRDYEPGGKPFPGEWSYRFNPDNLEVTARPVSHTGGKKVALLVIVCNDYDRPVEAALDGLASASSSGGAIPLGLHVEGPFLSPMRHGAHDPELLRALDLAELRTWTARGIRIVTLAPELPGGMEAVRLVADAGAVAAIGHTNADAETARAAIDAGARYATHLFNAMRPMAHRDPGAAGALLADERVTVGLIADGRHVDPTMLAVAGRAAAGRFSIVSDAVSSTLGHRALDRALDRADGDARLPDGTLAGGSFGLDHGVRTMAGLVGVDAAVEAVTGTPARLLSLEDGRGAVREGGRADLVLVTPDLEVALTIVGGRIVHRAEVAAG